MIVISVSQETVINALKTERDVSVRQRAVDLLYAMCDRSENFFSLMKKFMVFGTVASSLKGCGFESSCCCFFREIAKIVRRQCHQNEIFNNLERIQGEAFGACYESGIEKVLNKHLLLCTLLRSFKFKP